jgi:hypothetical protein
MTLGKPSWPNGRVQRWFRRHQRTRLQALPPVLLGPPGGEDGERREHGEEDGNQAALDWVVGPEQPEPQYHAGREPGQAGGHRSRQTGDQPRAGRREYRPTTPRDPLPQAPPPSPRTKGLLLTWPPVWLVEP